MGQWASLFDGHVDVQGVMTPGELTRVPAKRGVLALLADGGEVIVLLTAADMRSRLRSRLTAPGDQTPSRSADLRGVTGRVLYKLAHSHFETDLHYARLVRAIWPDRCAELIAWKPAWFVHVDSDQRFPHFVPTREAGARAGRYIGPFASARCAERFTGLLVEAFDLCRDIRTLRQAPHAQRCPYGQMGRCDAVCDGTTSLQAYALNVGRAWAFARGRRRALIETLMREMHAAAAGLDFERAAAAKARLARLAELDADAFAHAAPLEHFNFVIVQPGGSVRRAAAFIASGARLRPAGTLDYPLRPAQLTALAKRAAAAAGRPGRWGPFDRLMAGLVSRYLFSSARRRGLIVRWGASMTGADLGGAIEAAADVLALRAPKPRAKKADRDTGGSPAD